MSRKLVFALTLLAVGLFALPAQAKEKDSVESRLDEKADSGVGGSARFTHSAPDTIGHVEITGLQPGSSARIVVHAGDCSGQSASSVTLAEVAADAKGKAVGDGLLLLKGQESVDFRKVADGAHSVSIVQQDKVVACGTLPKKGTLAVAVTDDAPPIMTIATIATAAVVLAGLVLFVVQRRNARPAA